MPAVEAFHFKSGQRVPNHPRWPLLVYRAALPGASAEDVEERFARHGWRGAWRNGIYPFAHYHSNAHEVLAVVAGRARVRLGGDAGETLDLKAGDVAVLPAGTGHQRVEASDGFLVVGAYPEGQEDYDLCREDDDPEAARARVRRVPRPEQDPVYGADGPLLDHWPA